MKKRLPSICFSGKFPKRESSSLLQHSGLICLDVDDVSLEEVSAVKEALSHEDEVMAIFVSPSGNGVKILIKIPPQKATHKSCFLAIEQDYNRILGKFNSTKKEKNGENFLKVSIDKSGKRCRKGVL